MKKLSGAAAFLSAVLCLAVNSYGQAVYRMSRVATNGAAAAERSPKALRWHVSTTANFRVFATSQMQTEQIAAAAESLRAQLAATWLGENADAVWAPCCDIVVHPSLQSYLCAVGAGAAQTSGCSTVVVDRGQITARRIDLRSDNRDPLTAALPHELTHVVLSDRYLDRRLPRWADEGIALLSDPAAKLAGHERDLRAAIHRGTRIPLAALVRMNDYPADRIAAFYAQSASLVRLLVGRGSEAVFLDFLDAAARQGYDVALAETYGIQGVHELERIWMQEILDGRATKAASPAPKLGSAGRTAIVAYSPSASQ